MRRKKAAVLWASSGLPADAYALVAVPDRPAALVLCPCYVVLVQQVRAVLVPSFLLTSAVLCPVLGVLWCAQLGRPCLLLTRTV